MISWLKRGDVRQEMFGRMLKKISPGNVIKVQRQPRPAPIRYSVAVLLVVATLWLRVALKPVIGEQSPFITFFLTVVRITWFVSIGSDILDSYITRHGSWS